MSNSSIPRHRTGDVRRPIRSTSLRALAVAARLERGAKHEAPPGGTPATPAPQAA